MSSISKLNFEQTINKLEGLVSELESGELELEEALNKFEQGILLARQGQTQLSQAEQRVSILLGNDSQNSGQQTELSDYQGNLDNSMDDNPPF